MKILQVIHQFLPKHMAGSEIYCYHLSKELQKKHDVRLFFAESDSARPNYSVRTGEYRELPFTEVVNKWRFLSYSETYRNPRIEAVFEKVLSEFQPDIVHVQHILGLSAGIIEAAKRKGIPVVVTLHEYWFQCAADGQRLLPDETRCAEVSLQRCAECLVFSRRVTPKIYGKQPWAAAAHFLPEALRPLIHRFRRAFFNHDAVNAATLEAGRRTAYLRKMLGLADLVIAPSEFLRSEFIRWGLRSERIRHSDYGFDKRPFEGLERTESPRLRFAYVGSLIPSKGVHVLMEAFNGIAAGAASLTIYGNPRTNKPFAASLVRNARHPDIFFAGEWNTHQISEIYRDIDVLIVPSIWFENSPLTIHEAFMAGVPVIASDLGGMAELVADGVNGLLFRAGDPADLRARIQALIDDPELVRKFAARRTPVKSIAGDAEEMERLYETLAQKSRVPAADILSAGEPLDVSIVIPTWNGEKTLRPVLDAVLSQETDLSFEVILIDSQSSDGTREIVAGFQDPRLRLEAAENEFNHGETRNQAIAKARGKYVLLLVQDAVPAGKHWLEKMVAPFSDPEVAGVYGRQIPRQESGLFVKWALEKWIVTSPEPRVSQLGPGDWEKLNPLERYKKCCFDNVSSAVRKSVWRRMPFERVPFAEDLVWSRRVLHSGHKIVYQPEAAVIHSHDRPFLYELKRTYLCHFMLYRLFRMHSLPTAGLMFRAFLHKWVELTRFAVRSRIPAAEKLRSLLAAPLVSAVEYLGSYFGARCARAGRTPKIRGV